MKRKCKFFWRKKKKKEKIIRESLTIFWQGRHDSNMQPAVLETAALPLSHSPKFCGVWTMKGPNNKQYITQVFA